jgi:hypothetical protein
MPSCKEIIQLILTLLESLPAPSDVDNLNSSGQLVRESSWMTVDEIRTSLQKSHDLSVPAGEIENCLFAHEKSAARSIRSAKYPHTGRLVRLWGHVRNVGQGPEVSLAPSRTDLPIHIVGIDDFVGAPKVFISYANQDEKQAIEIGRRLSARRITAWLYELAINQNDFIFEGVREALQRSDALLALITPFSLASLWVRTETTSATVFGVPVHLAIPTDNIDLVNFLACGDDWKKAEELVRRFESSYRSLSTPTRIEKYADRVRGFQSQTVSYARQRAIVTIGDQPPEWRGMFNMVDLDTFASELLSRARTSG